MEGWRGSRQKKEDVTRGEKELCSIAFASLKECSIWNLPNRSGFAMLLLHIAPYLQNGYGST
jgi:hypothetical protein